MTSNAYWKSYYLDRRREAEVLLGGICCKCGTSEKLEFDHIDPSTKSFTITTRLRGLHTPEMQEELKKCQLLCRSCHREKTTADRAGLPAHNRGKWTHGTTTSYMAKACRCDECRSFYSVYKKEQRARRKGRLTER